ncbi:MAG: hypothetical protein IJ047_03695 [Paludibacteraceae bacterium]|nr:hypothetical protein [Paludibacteraceae bacterium]
MHLKTIVINRLKWDGFDFVSLPRTDTPHKRGVHYFRPPVEVKTLWGAMDTRKEGRHYKKRIVVRPSRFRLGLFELYAYHFPTRWSKACVANRELIKEAQKQAHAIEHDHSLEALTWRVRFFNHYFTVVKGGAKPEDGMKRYTRFYQYTYVSIYRQLQAERKKAQEPEPVSFEPVSADQPFRLQYKKITKLLHNSQKSSTFAGGYGNDIFCRRVFLGGGAFLPTGTWSG